MKLVLGFLAVIALTSALPFNGRPKAVTYGLKEDLADFAALIPTDQIVEVALDYLMNDAEVQEVVEYVQSDDFKQLVQDVEKQQAYIKFLNFLQASGLDVYAAVNKLHEFLGLDPLTPPTRRTARRGAGVRGMLDDIEALIPMDKIKALYYEKLESSPEFKALIERMRSEEIKTLVKEMINNPTLQEIVARGKEHGVDVKLVIDILNKIFDWGLEETKYIRASTYGLKEDLADFAALIPTDQIVEVALDYLMNDAEVQEVVEYVQSDDFKQLVQDVEKEQAYIKFLNFLQASGLDVYAAVNKLHEFLGLDPLTPPTRRTARRGTGVRGMLDDIEALIPMDKIKALYYEKLESSPEFKALIERMRSEEIKTLVKEMINNPTLQEIVARGKEHGVDVKLVIDILNKIFDWGLEETKYIRASTYGLKEDLADFAALIPTDQIVEVALDYLMNDAEVQEVVEYVQSDDFKQLVQDVEKQQAYIKFLNFLQASGLDVYAAVNKLHEFLGLDPLTPPTRRAARRGSGVRGMLDDIEALIPMDKIKALYYEKLESSPEFKALIERMRSEEIKTLVKEMINNPTLQEIVARGKEHGIDVKLVIDILNKIFDWGLEETRAITFSLKDDFDDFVKLIPKDKILDIALDYIFNDPEVQELIEYIQSPDFTSLLQEVENVPQFVVMMDYFQENGLDVYKALDLFHQFLGIPLYRPHGRMFHARRGQGVRGLLDDIEAVLKEPLKEIEALYNEKLTSSPDFAAFVKKMKSDEIKQTVQGLKANPKVQDFIERSKEHKIDVQIVFDILNKLFDWGL